MAFDWSRRHWRWPIKSAIFAIVAFFVLFPSPRLFLRHLEHWNKLQSMIEPDAPELDPLVARLHERLARVAATRPAAETASPVFTEKEVERFVLEEVAYEWDWVLWGPADYLPTVAEIFEKARQTDGKLREDCDGRAVIAASLMARLGSEPRLVTDVRHAWVTTRYGEYLGRGKAKTIISSPEGNILAWRTLLANIPSSLSFGMAVFPLHRELILVAAAFVLLWHRCMSAGAALAALVLLIQGLLFMRLAHPAPVTRPDVVLAWPAYVGAAHVVAGLALLWAASSRARRLADRGAVR